MIRTNLKVVSTLQKKVAFIINMLSNRQVSELLTSPAAVQTIQLQVVSLGKEKTDNDSYDDDKE